MTWRPTSAIRASTPSAVCSATSPACQGEWDTTRSSMTSSSRRPDFGGKRKLHETRQCFHPRKPGKNVAIAAELDIALWRPRHIAVERDIGDRRPFAGDPLPSGEFAVEHRQYLVCAGYNLFGPVRRIE